MLLVDWEVRVNMVTWDSSQADHDFGGVVMGVMMVMEYSA